MKRTPQSRMNLSNKYWKESELETLKDNFQSMSLKRLAKLVNHSFKATKNRIEFLGLARDPTINFRKKFKKKEPITELTRENLRKSHIGKIQSKETIQKRVNKVKEKRSLGLIAKPYHKLSKEERQPKIDIANTKRLEERKRNPEKWNIAYADRKITPEKEKIRIEKIQKHSIEMWKNPLYAEKVITNSLKGLIQRPTSFEQKIILLCSEYRLPFVYTGDGRILIGQKNPDFINEKDKIIIEVFLNFFKIKNHGSVENYIKERQEHFSKLGYKTIFIREEEIEAKNWKEICLNKIREVYNEH